MKSWNKIFRVEHLVYPQHHSEKLTVLGYTFFSGGDEQLYYCSCTTINIFNLPLFVFNEEKSHLGKYTEPTWQEKFADHEKMINREKLLKKLSI